MKKFATMVTSVALIGAMVAGGSLAYLSDTDSAVNVMTLGSVKITQHEYQRATNADGTYKTDTIDNRTSYVLEDFEQAKPLYPAIIPNGGTVNGVTWDYDSTPVRMSQVKSHGGASVFNTPNAQDKFVTVENTGKSDAYVRTLIAFEVGTATLDDANYPNQTLIGTEIRAKEADKNSNGEQPWTLGFADYVEIDGNKYLVKELVYTGAMTSNGWKHENGVLPAGETTYPSLCQVYMASRATNEDVEALDGNKNGTYDILVLSQAVQVAGFDNAKTALEAAFGVANVKNAKAWFTGEEFTIPTAVATADELVAALTNGEDVYLTKDITADADTTITIAKGTEATLNLNGYTIDAISDATGSNRNLIDVHGTLTVKNGAIEYEHTGTNMGWGNSTNVFNVTDGGVLNIEDATIENNGGSDMAFAVHLNNWGEVTLNVENSTLKSTYMAVRVFNSGYDMNNVTIKNSTLVGNYGLWVHNYTAADFGSAEKAETQAKLLNFDVFNGTNTFDCATAAARYGFTDSFKVDASGKVIE